MLRALILCGLMVWTVTEARATRVTGTVTDDKGNALSYASILVKGFSRGVSAGSDGKYALDLAPGEYTLVCQYVGYTRREKKISVGERPLVVDFQLSLQQLSMAEVVVRP